MSEWLPAWDVVCMYLGCGCVGGMIFLLITHWLVIAPLDRHAARLERELEDVQQRPTWPNAGTTTAP